jgi:hypothetical protein
MPTAKELTQILHHGVNHGEEHPRGDGEPVVQSPHSHLSSSGPSKNEDACAYCVFSTALDLYLHSRGEMHFLNGMNDGAD